MSGTQEKIKSNSATGKTESTDKSQPKEGGDDQRFWRTLKPAAQDLSDSTEQPATSLPRSASESTVKSVDLAGDMLDLSENERESRRHALRSMLAASEARQQGAMRARRPNLAIGERLAVSSGQFKNCQGTILDADFIHSRVLLQLDNVDEAQWIEFARISAIAP